GGGADDRIATGQARWEARVEGEVGQDDLGPVPTAFLTPAAAASDQGPCLYLGPAGQRCSQRAVKGGFCAAHQPGVTARAKVAKRSKIAAAIAGILGARWPYVYDFVHALMRIFHPR
ncbi:MAG: hypothetical protein KGL02_13960, partial [Acidobacteriota bacterium]|nr:hypothetical protein [Acidobacteriota bacterium]